MLKAYVFRANTRPEDCKRYIEAHLNTLRSFGVNEISSIDPIWLKNPDVFIMILEESESGEIIAGGRLQFLHDDVPLPVESAIGSIDPRIHEIVRRESYQPICEYCGLWSSKKYASYGVGSMLLMRMGIALLTIVGASSCIAFISPAIYKNCLKIGFRHVEELKNEGVFYYPTPEFKSRVLLINDPVELESASKEERIRIFELRSKPIQLYEEAGIRGKILVEYNLTLNRELQT